MVVESFFKMDAQLTSVDDLVVFFSQFDTDKTIAENRLPFAVRIARTIIAREPKPVTGYTGSEKQKECMEKEYAKVVHLREALERLMSIEPSNVFYASLSTQLARTGGLSQRQEACVEADVEKKLFQ